MKKKVKKVNEIDINGVIKIPDNSYGGVPMSITGTFIASGTSN